MISSDADAQSVTRLAACFQVLAVAGAVDTDCAARLRPHGLSESRFLLLFLLRHPDGLPPGRSGGGDGGYHGIPA